MTNVAKNHETFATLSKAKDCDKFHYGEDS